MPRIVALVTAALALICSAPAMAQSVPVNELAAAVVRLKTYINPDARTGSNLGHQREGSAVVIDSGGLLLTIGYLMVEAQAAEVITHLAFYAGWPNAFSALPVAKDVFEKRPK